MKDYTIVKRRAHSDNCVPDYEDNEILLLVGKEQAAIRMKAQLNEDSEEEYLDDPIKLFDFEQERVHFGSQTLQCSNTSTYGPYRSEDNVLIENNPKLTETLDGPDINVENFCENNCLPSSVKLVDCGKYPWYYKKYSQQILSKLNIFNLVSDDDSEEDISGDNSDCIIVEDIIDQLDRNIKDYSSKILPEIICKTALEKRQETMKLKEDIEIQIALSLKNTHEIDLKRNKGLIGIKITRKPVTDNDVNIEINKKNKHLKITTISKDKSSTNDDEIKTKNSKSDELVKNLPVQVNLGEMSEKLLERIIKKKNDVQSRESTPEPYKLNKSNEKQKSGPKSSKSSSVSNKVPVKDTTHANQVNTNEKLPSELIVPQTNHKKKTKNYAKQVEQQIDLNQTSPKRHGKDKDEPNSPILPCSSNLAKKNRSLSKIIIENKNRDTYKIKTVTNKIDDNNKVVNKPVADTSDESVIINKASKYNKILNSIKASKHHKSPNSMKLKLSDNKVIKKNEHTIQNVDNNIGQLSENVKTYKTTLINDKCNDSDPKMNNDVKKLDQPTINRVVQTSVNRGVTVTFGETVNDSQTTYKCAPSTNVVRPQFQLSVATNDSSKTAPFTNGFKPNSFTPNSSGNEMNLNNIKTNNNTAHSSYGSAIILRPMIPVRAQLNHNNLLKEVPRMSLQLQPRFYPNPYTANYHRSLVPLPDHRLNPRSASCSSQNYRFPTPQEIGYPPQYFPRQFQPIRNGCYQHKDLPYWFQKSSEQHKIYPYPLQSALDTKSVSEPQSCNISQSKNAIQLHNSIGNNNVAMAKKKFADPRMMPLNSVDTDLVTSKTKMLEVLDSATNNLESDITENDFTERVQEPVNNFKMPNVASKLDLTNIDDYRKLMEQQRDYTKNPISRTISELYANQTKSLEHVSKDLKRGIDAIDSKEKVQQPVNIFKRPKINKLEQASEDYKKQIEQAGAYSPPILPIPTFQNILHRVTKDVQKKDQHKMKNVSTINVKEINHNGKRMQNNTPQRNSRNLIPGRKISIEEYKMRTLQMNKDQFINSNNNVCRNGNDKNKPNLQNKPMYNNVERCSTESDLGYDSDSTVIL